MDALARLAPVAGPLLRDVDNALATLGAPAEHAVWGLLRRLGTTPGDAVAYFVDLDPNRLRMAGAALRDQAAAYMAVTIPATVPWEGSAAQVYAVNATALRSFLDGDEAESLAGRLRSTASYVEAVADWAQHSRDQTARVVARVLTSSQAVTIRSFPALGRGLAEVMRAETGGGLARAVLAAADIGAAVLGVAEDAVVAGRDQHHAGAASLAELTYRPPAQPDVIGSDGTIRLHH